ncbi:GIY-YIG nuclease family protein [Plectonema radiosum NIES-515]|uniref:GIY-YIG nuclease family protein n=1 Tax=Plectonema radiosum NIES-515 TaxID=2986073 RepID=A0ABT3AZF7_9CYAN|nr:GIY-YIG nuclease family protein [Plectonema radiosum]MCV3214512.1 GIY-YIG nuclease family protein [Plectonema radiosum NIES-515]
MTWHQRNDNIAGYIYLFKAKGFHGWLPGCVLGRYKIGLSRNPESRLDTLISNQPPTDYLVVRMIEVEDMATVESAIHQQFKACNVKLEKSREWFDLMPWQLAMVHLAFNKYEARRWKASEIPVKAITGGLIALLGVVILLGHTMQSDVPQFQPKGATEKIK